MDMTPIMGSAPSESVKKLSIRVADVAVILVGLLINGNSEFEKFISMN